MKPITDEQLEILANEVDKMRLGEIVSLNKQLQQAQVIINEAGTAVFSAWLEVAQLTKANAVLRQNLTNIIQAVNEGDPQTIADVVAQVGAS